MADHPQVEIEHEDVRAEVDEVIAPLLLDLWRLGLWTSLSCQDNFGKVWIEFVSADDAEPFLSIAAGEFDEGIESLYNRVSHGYEPEDWEAFREDRAWGYEVHPDDQNVTFDSDEEDEVATPRPIGPPAILLYVSVRFPRSDLAEVERRVAAYRLGQESATWRLKRLPKPTSDL